jgi:hypothetical protein
MTALALLLLGAIAPSAPNGPKPLWSFAVSGDSRDCGNVVMPAIAASVQKSGARFYWHLGDFRYITDFDEDMVPPPALGLATPHLSIGSYLAQAWPSFVQNQLRPFGTTEVFLGIGNHETVFPATEEAYLKQFEAYLKSPRLETQRAEDGDPGGPRTYYHFRMDGSLDFLSLDNARGSAFDKEQLAWITARLAADRDSPAIRTVVVGMHEALPGSKGAAHSMCASPEGTSSGRAVYELLWGLEAAGKKVYVLASHSHLVMDDVYRGPYWGTRVLPGWIVGTAGAVRYRLPPGVEPGATFRTDVYGYLLGTVMSDGSVRFEFHEVGLDDLRVANADKAPDALVQWCVSQNKDERIPKPGSCAAP